MTPTTTPTTTRRRGGPLATAVLLLVAAFSVASAPAAQAAPVDAETVNTTAQATQCLGYRTVNAPFHDERAPNLNRVFTVQFTNIHVCYNGQHVWFTDEPQFRVYIAGQFSYSMQGACTGISKTPTDPRNEGKRSSIYITCNAVFSNKGWGSFYPKSDIDINGSSRFTIPGFLNAGLNLGTAGAISTPVVADQARYYTIRIFPYGTYELSGVGNPGGAPL